MSAAAPGGSGWVPESVTEMSEDDESFAFQNNLTFPSRTVSVSVREDGIGEVGLDILASSRVASSI